MLKILFKKKKFVSLVLVLIFGVLNSGCSDFRQAIGKEKYIPNEYSFLNTPRLVIPPDFGNTDNIINNKSIAALPISFPPQKPSFAGPSAAPALESRPLLLS